MMLVRRTWPTEPSRPCQALAPQQANVLEDCSKPAFGQYEFVGSAGRPVTRAWLCDDHKAASKALTARKVVA